MLLCVVNVAHSSFAQFHAARARARARARGGRRGGGCLAENVLLREREAFRPVVGIAGHRVAQIARYLAEVLLGQCSLLGLLDQSRGTS